MLLNVRKIKKCQKYNEKNAAVFIEQTKETLFKFFADASSLTKQLLINPFHWTGTRLSSRCFEATRVLYSRLSVTSGAEMPKTAHLKQKKRSVFY